MMLARDKYNGAAPDGAPIKRPIYMRARAPEYMPDSAPSLPVSERPRRNLSRRQRRERDRDMRAAVGLPVRRGSC